MSKGRQPPPAQIDHAAQLRERLGRAAHDAGAGSPSDEWEALDESGRAYWRNIAQAVLGAIKTPGQRMGNLSVASIFTPDGRPFVELTMDTSPAQFSPAKAREIALLLLEAADAAESDAALAQFGREVLDLDMAGSARLIDQFRRLREARRGKGARSA